MNSMHSTFVLCLYLVLASGRSLTIDQIIASATKDEAAFDFIGDISGSVIRLELDMLVTYEQFLSLYSNQSTANSNVSTPHLRWPRKAIRKQTSRWTNSEIPYAIQRSTFQPHEIEEIYKAIQEWERHTCIRFVHVSSAHSNYINFQDGDGCSSFIGMGYGKQAISLADGCREKGVIAHEIGHAVGFFHEQNRPDRDRYIAVKTENIAHPLLRSNFERYSSEEVDTFGVPYDYKSIMHYGGFAFSGNGKQTIVTRDPAYQKVIGNRDGLSFHDIKLANLMYKCSDSCRSPVTCPSEGFLGKDCQCWCPGSPRVLCGTGNSSTTKQPLVTPTKPSLKPSLKTTPKAVTISKSTLRPMIKTTTKPRITMKPPTRKPEVKISVKPTGRPTTYHCVDLNTRCADWAKLGVCQYSIFMRAFCRASCGLCQTKAHPVATTQPCRDVRPHCQYWGGLGYCSGLYSNFMSRNCPVTCGTCERNVYLNPVTWNTKKNNRNGKKRSEKGQRKSKVLVQVIVPGKDSA